MPHIRFDIDLGGAYMKLLVAGSRSIKEYDLEGLVPEGVTLIITGGAVGIDAIAEQYADRRKISKLILRPRYDLYGKGGPLKRNEKMVELCDMALVIWDGKSRGAKYTIECAKRMGKTVRVITAPKKA